VSISASGEITALVAAVGPRPTVAARDTRPDGDRLTALERRVERAERALTQLAPSVVESLARRVHSAP
jgi:hypothetical protein